jgi:hypothetical protein
MSEPFDDILGYIILSFPYESFPFFYHAVSAAVNYSKTCPIPIPVKRLVFFFDING